MVKIHVKWLSFSKLWHNLKFCLATRNDKTTSYVKRCVKFCKFKVQNTRKLLLTRGAKAHTQIRHTIININFWNIFCIKNFTKVYKTCILIILPWYKNDLLLKTSGNIENILSGPLDPYKANCVVKYIQLMRVNPTCTFCTSTVDCQTWVFSTLTMQR